MLAGGADHSACKLETEKKTQLASWGYSQLILHLGMETTWNARSVCTIPVRVSYVWHISHSRLPCTSYFSYGLVPRNTADCASPAGGLTAVLLPIPLTCLPPKAPQKNNLIVGACLRHGYEFVDPSISDGTSPCLTRHPKTVLSEKIKNTR